MVLSHLRLAVRSLLRWPTGTIASLFILALGIGAATAVFSLVQAVLLNPLGYAQPDRLAVVLNGGMGPVSAANFFDLKEQTRAFGEFGAAQVWSANLTGAGPAEGFKGAQVSANVFRMLGVKPHLGRIFEDGEDTPGRDKVVVLRYGLWQQRFGADPGIVGKQLRLNGERYTVIGVMPNGFEFPPPFWAAGGQIWSPLDLTPRRHERGGNSLRLFGRLASGVSMESAHSEITALNARLIKDWPNNNAGLDLQVVPLHEKVTGRFQALMFVLLGASGFVLLIACANVAQLLLARATGRRKEIAVRVALGARTGDLMRLILAESVTLSVVGGALGITLAYWAVQTLVHLAPADIPRIETASLNGDALLFGVTASVLTGVFFGLAPALRQARMDPQTAMREEAAAVSEGAGGRNIRRVLVVAEVAMAVVLTVGTGLLVRSFVSLNHVDAGFNTERLLSMVISVNGAPSAEPARRLVFYDEILRRVRETPGVDSASYVNHLPLGGDIWTYAVTAPGWDPGLRLNAAYRVADVGYFATMGIRLTRGREFTIQDTMRSSRVAIINETLARTLFSTTDAIGKRVLFGSWKDNPDGYTVVGVIADAKQREWAEEAMEELYLPLRQDQNYLASMTPRHMMQTLVVKTSIDPSTLARSLRTHVHALDSEAPVSQVFTMDELVAQQLARPRFAMSLVSSFGAIALLLAMAGIYGVISYMVSRRVREIGIRMALGASASSVSKMIARQTAMLIAPGIVLGLALAFALERFVRGLVYGVSATDPISFAIAPLLFAATALAASWLPARRASRIDPLTALRDQ